jgi:anti-anti-sigma factor
MAATRQQDMPEEVLAQLGIAISAQGTTTTISLRGEWDLAQKPAMRSVINDVLERAPDCVVLDLSELSFIDSTGVHGVLELHKRSTQQHAHLVIVPGHRAVQRIFEITGLTEVLPFLPTQTDTKAGKPRSTPPRQGNWRRSLPATHDAGRRTTQRPASLTRLCQRAVSEIASRLHSWTLDARLPRPER